MADEQVPDYELENLRRSIAMAPPASKVSLDRELVLKVLDGVLAARVRPRPGEATAPG